MNNPSTVADGGHRVIIPLAKIHATPSKGTIPNAKESTSIIARNATSYSTVNVYHQIQIALPRVHSKTYARFGG